MATINQLVRKNRTKKTRKSKSPVLGVRLNSLTKKSTETASPQKEEFVLVLELRLQRNQTQLYVSMLV